MRPGAAVAAGSEGGRQQGHHPHSHLSTTALPDRRAVPIAIPAAEGGQGRQAGGQEAQGNQSLLCCRPLRARLAPLVTIPTQPFRLLLSKAPVWSSLASALLRSAGQGTAPRGTSLFVLSRSPSMCRTSQVRAIAIAPGLTGWMHRGLPGGESGSSAGASSPTANLGGRLSPLDPPSGRR